MDGQHRRVCSDNTTGAGGYTLCLDRARPMYLWNAWFDDAATTGRYALSLAVAHTIYIWYAWYAPAPCRRRGGQSIVLMYIV